jgi:hypothetical protein
MAVEQISDRRADQVAAIAVEAFGDQEVDLAEVDEAEIDRDLLTVGSAHRNHPCTIQLDGICCAAAKTQELVCSLSSSSTMA